MLQRAGPPPSWPHATGNGHPSNFGVARRATESRAAPPAAAPCGRRPRRPASSRAGLSRAATACPTIAIALAPHWLRQDRPAAAGHAGWRPPETALASGQAPRPTTHAPRRVWREAATQRQGTRHHITLCRHHLATEDAKMWRSSCITKEHMNQHTARCPECSAERLSTCECNGSGCTGAECELRPHQSLPGRPPAPSPFRGGIRRRNSRNHRRIDRRVARRRATLLRSHRVKRPGTNCPRSPRGARNRSPANSGELAVRPTHRRHGVPRQNSVNVAGWRRPRRRRRWPEAQRIRH